MASTILVIEDMSDVQENIAEILEMDNYKVLTASDGREGVKLALEHKPDLIICDISMPVLDGYGVLHMLQKRDEMSHIPFIFLSARAERTDIRKGMELGADDYLVKPFDPMELLHAVEIRLKKSQRLRQELTPDLTGFNSLLQTANGNDLLKDLREGRNINSYKKKQLIYAAGNHPTYMYFILKGKVKTSRHNEDGKEIITRIFNEGEFLGYKALLEEGTYQDEAEAITPVELAVIPRSDFEALVYSNMDVMRKFLRLLTANISESEQHLLGLAYNSLRKKVADALLYLYRKYNPDKTPGFSLDIGRDNIAAIAGVAKESLIRTLGDFRDEQLIRIEEGSIMIENLAKLERMVN
ncbi:response regulator [Chitinophaga sp. YIM B06452]|uniref:response regulator n=1 Tax=Chitinophaga sp. YIM B06452 TaxID=3082158 RepID=UPI0031FEBFD9